MTVYEVLFQNCNEAILLVNQKGLIELTNPRVEELFGYKKGELVGQNLNLLIPHRYQLSHNNKINGYVDNPTKRYIGGRRSTLYGMRSDGLEIPLEISLSPYQNEGEMYILAYIVEISERIKVEEALRENQKNLEQIVETRTLNLQNTINELQKTKSILRLSLEKEKELNTLKSKFVSTVSHEFRNPLATISSSLSLVKRYAKQQDLERQTLHLDRIKKNVTHLTEMLSDILEVSSIEEGRIKLHLEPINLEIFFEDLRDDFYSIIDRRNELTLQFENVHSKSIISDKKLFLHIFQNLISNAYKFSFRETAIQVLIKESEEEFYFEVQNEGIGIEPNDRPYIFDRFYRASNVENIPGTGLGLSIVEQYVRLLSGEIDFESEINQKTIFKLKFLKK